MNKYESIIIINTNITEENRKKVIDKITDLINQNGKIDEVKKLGKKKLAYKIKNNTEGDYLVFYFESESEFIRELERVYRITDEVLKFIVVRKDE